MDSFTTIHVFTVIIFLGSGNLCSHLSFFSIMEYNAGFLTTINIAWGLNHITPMMFFSVWKSYTFVKKCYFPHIATTVLIMKHSKG